MEISHSVEELTGTATFSVPILKEKLGTLPFAAGNKVAIEAGYNGNYQSEFTGVILKVNYDEGALQVECEDDMRLLKSGKQYAFYLKNATIKAVLNQLQIPFKTKLHNASIGNFKAQNLSAYQVLEKLKEDYKTLIYLKGDELRVIDVYDNENKGTSIHLERNVRGHNLSLDTDRKVKIEARSTLKKGKKAIVVRVGDDDGEVYKLQYFGVALQSKLKEKAEKDLERLKRDKVKGSISAFATPYVQVGAIVMVKSKRTEAFNSAFGAKKVSLKYDSPKLAREIEIEPLV
ncbi:phage late control protein D protein [Elysia marginata]|uniref:Phage late control protein D protein n=1 Tax=Elysia marginata TaxID=1093978 RepID=A0AAV4GWR2_9GAST|nr:phage late control protein D protein [Elysia marginata]